MHEHIYKHYGDSVEQLDSSEFLRIQWMLIQLFLIATVYAQDNEKWQMHPWKHKLMVFCTIAES